MEKLDYAQLFKMMGIAVIPLRHRGKEPASHMMGGSWERYKSQLPAAYDITNWLWSGWQNYGVVAGWNNLAIIDFDDALTFDIWLDYFKMLNSHHAVYETPFMVKTSRGAHVYITTPGEGKQNRKLRGVDVKIHGYVVGPMSTHPSGAIYQPINNNMVFPQVFDLDTLLPPELFPPVAVSEIAEPVLELPFIAPPRDTEYDPFQIASGASQGLDLITKVKQAVRIENLFPDRRRSSADGRWYAVRCPFHNDKTPSAHIDVIRGWFSCEVCKMKPMDVINLYARQHHVSDSIAVLELAKQIGV